jgi:hypothetical protein
MTGILHKSFTHCLLFFFSSAKMACFCSTRFADKLNSFASRTFTDASSSRTVRMCVLLNILSILSLLPNKKIPALSPTMLHTTSTSGEPNGQPSAQLSTKKSDRSTYQLFDNLRGVRLPGRSNQQPISQPIAMSFSSTTIRSNALTFPAAVAPTPSSLTNQIITVIAVSQVRWKTNVNSYRER